MTAEQSYNVFKLLLHFNQCLDRMLLEETILIMSSIKRLLGTKSDAKVP